ncbi:hypothetical protein ABW19_dt0209494 [Dactylella cylindrospora]|nr:hypothetical protein ABW19_dt0209494 [Dactylella cylindrospora]
MSPFSDMANTEATHQHGSRVQPLHRVQSTNMLFPSNVDPMDGDPRTGLRVAPTERRAACAASRPYDMTYPWVHQQALMLESNSSLSGIYPPSFAPGLQPSIRPSINTNSLQLAQFSARGFMAGLDMAPMFGDKPPQSPNRPKSGSPRADMPSAYNLGFGFNTNTHYSYKPDILLVDAETDKSMAEWEKELFKSYRSMKYYGEEKVSKEKTADILQKFTTAARGAWNKLATAANSGRVSVGFKMFVQGLGGFENLTKIGFKNLDLVMEGGTPRNLTGVYSVLHVAYALSQTASEKFPDLPKPISVSDFQRDATRIWRLCLDKEKNTLGYSERQVFDELLAVMTQEVDSALEWIKDRTCLMELTNSEEQEDQNNSELCNISPEPPSPISDITHGTFEAVSLRSTITAVRPSSSHLTALPPEGQSVWPTSSTWAMLASGKIFTYMVDFLKCLPKLGSAFLHLCGMPYFALRGRQCTVLSPVPEMPEFKTRLYQLVIGPVFKQPEPKPDFKPLLHLFRAAVNMVQLGAIRTLRDFENYTVSLSKLCDDIDQRNEFLMELIPKCLEASSAFGEMAKQAHQPSYSQSYVRRRLTEEQAIDSVPSQIFGGLASPVQKFEGDMFDIRSDLVPISHGYQDPVVYDDLQRYPNFDLDTSSDLLGYKQSPGSLDCMAPLNPPLQAYPVVFSNAVAMQSAASQFQSPQLVPSMPFAEGSPGTLSSPTISSASSPDARFSPNTTISDGSMTRSGPIRRAARRGNKAPEGRKFICDVPGCGAEIRGSKYTMSNSNLLRHKRSAHPDPKVMHEAHNCPIPGCRATYKGSRGRENLKTHMKNKHSEDPKASLAALSDLVV